MKVIKLDPRLHSIKSDKGLKEAIKHLKAGGVIVYPTETAYGLGADARSEEAVKKIFALKRRRETKTLPVIVGTMRQAKRLAGFSVRAADLARRFWPGPLTLVLPIKPGADLARGMHRDGWLAMRISSHPIAAALARGIRGPIVSTSANVSGKGECYSASAVQKQFSEIPDFDALILDAGSLRRVKPSTILKITDREIKVLRFGTIRGF